MTREEAKEAIKEAYGNSEYTDEIIKALKQEPKSEWEQDHDILKAYSDGADDVIDKIRAEIGRAWCTKPKNRYEEGLKDQALKDLKIIDKYKGESEKQTDGNHENKKS